jgi:preprotein translocase subunit SecD
MSRRRDPLAIVALIAVVVGFVLLVAFDAWFTRLLGVLALFAFVAAGVFAIASPALLEQEEEGPAGRAPGSLP